jgi:hypothetical protein
MLCKLASEGQHRGAVAECRYISSIQKGSMHMRKVLRGYAKDQDGNLILIGTIPVPHSKDKRCPRERRDQRHLVRQGATIFKKEIVR